MKRWTFVISTILGCCIIFGLFYIVPDYLKDIQNRYIDKGTTVLEINTTPNPTMENKELFKDYPAKMPTEDVDYILNKNSKIFHKPDCYSVKQMKESNKVYFQGVKEEIIARGYNACQRCLH